MKLLKYLAGIFFEDFVKTLLTLFGVSSITLTIYFYDELSFILNKPAPTWLVLLSSVSLLFLFVYFKNNLRFRKPKTFFIEDQGLKWKVTDFRNGSVEIDNKPYCIEHKHQYIDKEYEGYMCREKLCSDCESDILDWHDIKLKKDLAKSKAITAILKVKTKNI